MRQDERRLVALVQITAELQGADALGGAGENRNGHLVVAARQLAPLEGGAAGDTELLAAALALEQPARLVLVDRYAAPGRYTGSSPVSCHRSARNVASAWSSDMRATCTSERVQALADRRNERMPWRTNGTGRPTSRDC